MARSRYYVLDMFYPNQAFRRTFCATQKLAKSIQLIFYQRDEFQTICAKSEVRSPLERTTEFSKKMIKFRDLIRKLRVSEHVNEEMDGALIITT